MNTNYRNSILLLLVGLLALGHVPAGAFGFAVCIQVKKEDDPASQGRFAAEPNSVFLPPSRELIRPLVRAMRIQKEGDVVGAAELIGQFLADAGDEDFLIFDDKDKGTAVSVSSIATEMLGDLPKSALDAYRVRFGIPAQQRLNLAIAESNYFEIAQVKQRYLLTDAGYEAALLLGHHHFDEGRVLLAADCFQTALDLNNRRSKKDSKLSILTAVSWSLARRRDLAGIVMKNLAKSNGGTFRIGDRDVSIDESSPLATIDELVGTVQLDSTSTVQQWLLVGGNAKRNVTTVDGFPVGEPLWEVDLIGSLEDRQKIKSARKRISNDANVSKVNSLIPANVPLIVDGVVLAGTKNSIQAVDFSSGKRVWDVKTTSVSSKSNVTGILPRVRLVRDFQGRSYSSNRLSDDTTWSDFLQGHASSDGECIFRVVHSTDQGTNQVNARGFGGRVPVNVKSTNVLQAINVANEGELAWEVGGGRTTGDPRLTELSFLGAPLPVDGVLYAIGRRLEEIVLVALNSNDGKMIWLQSLASNEDFSLNRYSRNGNSKDNYSLTPSYSDGILVCPTGKNALVAIDTVGRRLMWGIQATIGRAVATTGRLNYRITSTSSTLAKLQNPQVFVENSRVVAFDVGSNARLLAMDLLTGSPLMKIGKAGVKVPDVLHVARVDESMVVLVEKTRVRAISHDTGRQLWQASLANYGQPTGRGYVSQVGTGPDRKSFLYLPTEGNAIVKISLDAERGKVVDGIRSNRSFGNLIVHQGRIISRGDTSVACFEIDSNAFVDDVDASATPELKIKRAALLRNRGRVQEAIELLETIGQRNRSDRFRTEFVQNVALMFEFDPDYALNACRDYEDWFQFDTNPQLFLKYVELLVENDLPENVIKKLFRGDAFFAPNDSAAQPDTVQRPLAAYSEQQLDQEKEEQKKNKNEQTDDGTSLFLKNQRKFTKGRITFEKNQWAKAQLIRLTRNSPESKKQVEAAINQRVAAAELINVVQRHQFLRQFPLELVSPQLRLELAEELIAGRHVAEAENLLASLVGFLPTKPEQIEAIEGLAINSLVELWSKVRDAQYGSKVASSERVDGGELASARPCDRVDVKVTRVPTRLTNDYPTHVEPRGGLANRLFKNKRLSILGRGKEFQILSPDGNSEHRFNMFSSFNNNVNVHFRAGSGWLQANHSLAVLRQTNVILTMDLSKMGLGQSSVRWHKILTAPKVSSSDYVGEMDLRVNKKAAIEDVTASFPTTGCCCFIDQNKLTCVDAFTGATLWTRTTDSGHLRLLSNGKEVVTLNGKQSECSVFDIRTGERLRTNEISKLTQALFSVDGTSFVSSSVASPTHLRTERESGRLTGAIDYRLAGGENPKEKKRSSLKKTGRFMSRYNVDRNDFVWQKVFSLESKICHLPEDRFLVLSGDNLIYVFDMKSGEQLAKIPSGLTADQRKRVRAIGTTSHAGKDLVVLASSKPGSITTYGIQLRSSQPQSAFFSGHLLLLDRDKVETVWKRPAELSGFHLLPLLPSASPLLIFNRTVRVSGGGRVSGFGRASKAAPGLAMANQLPVGNLLQFMALDMNDGHIVLNKVIGPINSVRFYPPKVDSAAGTIDMKFSDWAVRLNMKEALDEPPSPVASITKYNPVPENHRVSQADPVVATKKFDIDEVNQRLVRQAEEYEASLKEKRAKERAQLKSEAGQME